MARAVIAVIVFTVQLFPRRFAIACRCIRMRRAGGTEPPGRAGSPMSVVAARHGGAWAGANGWGRAWLRRRWLACWLPPAAAARCCT